MKRDRIETIFEQYGPMVFRRARQILGNDADGQEAAQEVFIRALRSEDRFSEEHGVSAWLYRITTNYCLNQIRDRKRRRELWLENQPPDTGVPEGAARTSPDRMILMRRLLAAADETQAQAALCVFVDGMSHDEAAKVLEVSRRTVGNLLERFQKWAVAYLEEAPGEPDDEADPPPKEAEYATDDAHKT